MSLLLILLLSLYYLPTNTEVVNSPRHSFNVFAKHDDDFNSIVPPEVNESSNKIESSENLPFVKTGPDQTEVGFRHPIGSVNIDYSKNAIVLKFRKPRLILSPEEEDRRKSLENNFMRFGRNPPQDFMRFDKRAFEKLPNTNILNDDESRKAQNGNRFERSSENLDKNGKMGLRDSRGDNFMRFGRSPGQDFMRFGRIPGQDFMRFGRDPGPDFMRLGRAPGQDFMRFGRDPGQDFMRLGRAPGQDFMRFGRAPEQDFMRFGRAPGQDFMRFGRDPGQDFMRLGRAPGEDFMRFGRTPGQDFMRFGRSPADFMRLGRDANQNFMRLGRNPGQNSKQFGPTGSKTTRGTGTDQNFMRFGPPDNFMRFGRSDTEPPSDKSSNFMRFGRTNSNVLTDGKNDNHTQVPVIQKSDIKEAARILHETESDTDESNPVDKAIQVLFSKHGKEEELGNASGDDSSQEEDYQQ